MSSSVMPLDDEPSLHPARATRHARNVAPRLLASIWLVLLVSPVQSVLESDSSTSRRALCLISAVFFAATYMWQLAAFPLNSDQASSRRRPSGWVPVLLLTGLSAAMTFEFGASFHIIFVFAGVSVGACLATETAPKALVAVIAIATVTGALTGMSWSAIAGTGLSVFGIGALIILLAHLIATVRDLRAARMEIARLAVSEERLRFSRDLHDLLGLSLSLITLKSELAGRLVTVSPDRAAVEIHDIERIARSALQETREAVAGYRQPSLTSELRAAREILGAAGISFVSNGTETPFPSDIDAVLAWAVREGVTNVIRHSRATLCTVKVGMTANRASVEVTDNGTGHAVSTKGGGNGLRGLSERVQARSGKMDAYRKPDGGFVLAVTIPLPSPLSVENLTLSSRSA